MSTGLVKNTSGGLFLRAPNLLPPSNQISSSEIPASGLCSNIEVKNGKKILSHSFFAVESEVLLLPATEFVVKSQPSTFADRSRSTYHPLGTGRVRIFSPRTYHLSRILMQQVLRTIHIYRPTPSSSDFLASPPQKNIIFPVHRTKQNNSMTTDNISNPLRKFKVVFLGEQSGESED